MLVNTVSNLYTTPRLTIYLKSNRFVNLPCKLVNKVILNTSNYCDYIYIIPRKYFILKNSTFYE